MIQSKNNFEEFTNLYSLQKTLRFELKPIGKTLENLERLRIIERDQDRADSYKLVKKWIDDYHNSFIDSVLTAFAFSNEKLSEYESAYNANDKKKKEDVKKSMREELALAFADDPRFDKLFKDELIKEILPEVIQEDDKKSIINKFKNFTTYFSGYHENRQNMYSSAPQATAISYRIVDENLPKFIDNQKAFSRIKEVLSDEMLELYKNFEEFLNVSSISEIFSLDYFNSCLTQKDIEIYNGIIGGMTDGEQKEKVKGINEYVNIYNQQQKDKSKKLPRLNVLYKQILSERELLSWRPEEFKEDSQLLLAINKFRTKLNEKDTINKLRSVLLQLREFDLGKIYIKNYTATINDISVKLFEDYSTLGRLIHTKYESNNERRRGETDEKYYERIKKLIKNKESFSLEFLNDCAKDYKENQKPDKYFSFLGLKSNKIGSEEKSLFDLYEESDLRVRDLLKEDYFPNKKLNQDDVAVEHIKTYLDSLVNILHFIKPLLGSGDEPEKDKTFYDLFIKLYALINEITPLYNMVRNYITQKPYSDEKIKLHFDNNGKILSGWTDSQTASDNGTQYGGYLFRRRNSIGEFDYYLGISADTKLFRSFKDVKEEDKSSFERLDFYQLKNETFYGSLYKGDYAKESSNILKSIDEFVDNCDSREIIERVNNKKSKKNSKISTASGYLKFILKNDNQLYGRLLKYKGFEQANQAMMRSIRTTLESLNRIPLAKVKELEEKKYSIFSEMMEDVKLLLSPSYSSYYPISENELKNVTNRTDKPMFFFKIVNKDLSYAENFEKGLRKSRGKENLHTLYFKALMTPDQKVFKIGSGAVFFRERKIIYSEEQLKRGHHHDVLKNKFNYPIISNRRYAYDKFQFHLSTTLNYLTENNSDINLKAIEYLRNSQAVHFIGIDRGERHLLYVTVINSTGEIQEQFSLNEIVNEYKNIIYKTDYHKLLDEKEEDRERSRQSWKTIENIKELKQGYLSQVINKITQLMVKYNAVVVLEDLNMGFKQSRQKFEKSVYQQFEKALIDKLNYYVDKNKRAEDLGGLYNAYQLTNKFDSFKTMGKQNGFIFYIPAWMTSKIDPVTGFANFFNLKYENVQKSQEFFKKFDDISFNNENNCFDFTFDYMNFPEIAGRVEGTRTKWTISTYGERIETCRDPQKNNEWNSRIVNITNEMKFLLENHGIQIANIKQDICRLESKEFFSSLLRLLRLTLQLRNSIPNSEEDYIISPVADSNGKFFDSRNASSSLPANADANGAYNIARKGLMLARQIQDAHDIDNLKLSMTNKEWLNFVQTTPYKEDL